MFYRNGAKSSNIPGLTGGHRCIHHRDAHDKWAAARIARDLIAADENLNLVSQPEQNPNPNPNPRL